jgi:hypothetical protein
MVARSGGGVFSLAGLRSRASRAFVHGRDQEFISLIGLGRRNDKDGMDRARNPQAERQKYIENRLKRLATE